MQSRTPLLSICVPSRNRQVYFQETIKALTASRRDDVEFVFIDNSDDPSVMNGFIEPFLADPRVRYVPTGERVRPMVDNWEVGAQQTTGRWVTFIGDDDYMDPDAADLLARIEAVEPGVDVVDWTKISYYWPDPGRKPAGQPVRLGTEIHRVPRSLLMARTYRWESAKQVLVCGFSIYHGAVSRRLLERIRQTYAGRFFEHPVVDYDSVMKNVMHGENFVYVTRPLSVLGVCPLSNSATLGNKQAADKAQKAFHAEHSLPMDEWPCYADYPFRSWHGVTACIGMTHHWFSKTYGHAFKNFEANFAMACADQCEQSADAEQFRTFSEAYRAVFRTWKGGKYLRYFQPKFTPKTEQPVFMGWSDPNLYVYEGSPLTRTAVDFYRLVSDLLVPVAALPVELDRRVVDAGSRPAPAPAPMKRAGGARR